MEANLNKKTTNFSTLSSSSAPALFSSSLSSSGSSGSSPLFLPRSSDSSLFPFSPPSSFLPSCLLSVFTSLQGNSEIKFLRHFTLFLILRFQRFFDKRNRKKLMYSIGIAMIIWPLWKNYVKRYVEYQFGKMVLHFTRIYKTQNMPKRIILIRHAESEGNVNSKICELKADYEVCLTSHGTSQARKAGFDLYEVLGVESMKIYCSPYWRAKQTINSLLRAYEEAAYIYAHANFKIRKNDMYPSSLCSSDTDSTPTDECNSNNNNNNNNTSPKKKKKSLTNFIDVNHLPLNMYKQGGEDEEEKKKKIEKKKRREALRNAKEMMYPSAISRNNRESNEKEKQTTESGRKRPEENKLWLHDWEEEDFNYFCKKYHIQEEVRLREQETGFGKTVNDLTVEFPQRAYHGNLYYRFFGGESGADVYDRVSAFVEKLHRHFLTESCPQNFIIVSHGSTIKIMLMRLLHWTVDEFQTYDTIKNGELAVLEKTEDCRLTLVTSLHRRDMPKNRGEASPSRRPPSIAALYLPQAPGGDGICHNDEYSIAADSSIYCTPSRVNTAAKRRPPACIYRRIIANSPYNRRNKTGGREREEAGGDEEERREALRGIYTTYTSQPILTDVQNFDCTWPVYAKADRDKALEEMRAAEERTNRHNINQRNSNDSNNRISSPIHHNRNNRHANNSYIISDTNKNLRNGDMGGTGKSDRSAGGDAERNTPVSASSIKSLRTSSSSSFFPFSYLPSPPSSSKRSTKLCAKNQSASLISPAATSPPPTPLSAKSEDVTEEGENAIYCGASYKKVLQSTQTHGEASRRSPSSSSVYRHENDGDDERSDAENTFFYNYKSKLNSHKKINKNCFKINDDNNSESSSGCLSSTYDEAYSNSRNDTLQTHAYADTNTYASTDLSSYYSCPYFLSPSLSPPLLSSSPPFSLECDNSHNDILYVNRKKDEEKYKYDNGNIYNRRLDTYYSYINNKAENNTCDVYKKTEGKCESLFSPKQTKWKNKAHKAYFRSAKSSPSISQENENLVRKNKCEIFCFSEEEKKEENEGKREDTTKEEQKVEEV